jgi:lysyl-tRNA synthetase class 2
MSDHISEVHLSRVRNLNDWRSKGIEPYAAPPKQVQNAGDLQAQYAELENGQITETIVHVAGRIMSVRNGGMFIDLEDASGKIQVFSHKDSLNPECMNILSLFDLGDIIYATGIIRRTPRGELTVNSAEIRLLTKSLQPLPEKYHGLSDLETRYRRRHIDLAVNHESRDVFKKRAKIVTAMRHAFEERDFIEVETPMLHTIPGGAVAKPFVTHHNALDIPLYLRIAPELYLKRLIIGGVSHRVFEVNRCFRNEGTSPKHNPEFTSVEAYQAYADYTDMMELVEYIIETACKKVNDGQTKVTFKDKEIDFTAPWPRKTMTDLVKEVTGVDFMAIDNAEDAIAAAAKIGIKLEAGISWGKVVEEVFGERVEHTLIQPIHVTDMPRDVSPLAKVHPQNPRLTERFESYASGWEIANAFSELNDPFDQYQRFKSQGDARDAGDDEAHYFDEDFIEALEFGLPPTGGMGIGIDRVVMMLTDSHNIRDVIAFPTLRPTKANSLVCALGGEEKLVE